MHLSLFVAGFVAIALAVAFLGFLLPARRSRSVEKLARELNFKFAALAMPFEDTDVRGIEILENGPSTVVSNLLERTTGNCRFLICDIDTLPTEGAATTLTTTVAAFRMSEMNLPVFQIGEKNTVERVAEQIRHVFSKKLDEFDGDREFTRNFFVHCPAKDEARNFLTSAKLTYLREHAAHLRVECSPDWLFIYYGVGVRVETDNLKEFSEIASAMASVLLSIQTPKAA